MTIASTPNLTPGNRRINASVGRAVVTGSWYPSTGNGFGITTGFGSVAVAKHHAIKLTRRPGEVASH